MAALAAEPLGAHLFRDNDVRGSECCTAIVMRVWDFVKGTYNEWDSDNASRLAAALACYALLSLTPLVALSVTIAGLVLGRDAAQGRVVAELGAVVGRDAAKALEVVAAGAQHHGSGWLGAVVGASILLYGASSFFNELKSALNLIWGVKAPASTSVLDFMRERLIAFGMVLSVALLLLLSVAWSAVLSAVGVGFTTILPGGEFLWQVVNFFVSLAMTSSLFALVYKVVPDVRIAWSDVWMGALVTGVLFSVGRLALSLYLGKSGVTSSFGAAGSLVALVVWVYYSSQIVFLGAEFTELYARTRGRPLGTIKRARTGYAPEPTVTK